MHSVYRRAGHAQKAIVTTMSEMKAIESIEDQAQVTLSKMRAMLNEATHAR